MSAQALDKTNSQHMIYAWCPTCDVLYLTNIPPEDRNITDYSESGFYQRVKPKFSVLIDFAINASIAWRLHLVKRLIGNIEGKRVLDIGCGKGRFLYQAEKAGADVLGVEPTKRSYEFAKKHLGARVSNTGMSQALYPSEHVDVVTMWHVFEHIPDPVIMLGTCRDVLRQGGFLIIAVPNYKGWIAKFGGALWFNLDPPRHLVHYTPDSLKNLLMKHGFKVWSINYHYPELTYLSALQTTLNKLPITPNFLFNFLKRNKNAVPENKAMYLKDLILTSVGSLVILLPIIFFVPVASMMHRSDCITVIASKR